MCKHYFKFFSAYFIYSLAIQDNSDKFAILCIFREKKTSLYYTLGLVWLGSVEAFLPISRTCYAHKSESVLILFFSKINSLFFRQLFH